MGVHGTQLCIVMFTNEWVRDLLVLMKMCAKHATV